MVQKKIASGLRSCQDKMDMMERRMDAAHSAKMDSYPRRCDAGIDAIRHMQRHYALLDPDTIFRLEALDLSPIHGDFPNRSFHAWKPSEKNFQKMREWIEMQQMVGRPSGNKNDINTNEIT